MKFVDGWLSEAKEYNINENSWDRGGVKASHLVVHGTAGGSDGSATIRYMKSVGVSTHFAISTNGDIWQGVSCLRAAWGNAPLKSPHIPFASTDKNANLWTISIEFCKPDSTNQIEITSAQKLSGFALIRCICEEYNIPKRTGDGAGGVISHADINAVDRLRCPGTFPWQELWDYLSQDQHPQEEENVLQIEQVKDFFIEVEKDKRWRCKIPSSLDGKTYDIAYGLLDFYRKYGQAARNGFTILGTPISGELRVPKTEKAVIQLFKRGSAKYDPLGEIEDEVEELEGPCSPTAIDVGFAYECLIAPGTQIISNKVVTLQLELKRCLDTQALEPAHQALHKIYQIAQPFEQQKESI